MIADNLNGVFVGTNGTVTAESPEFQRDGSGCRGIGIFCGFQRMSRYIVHDADGKIVGILSNKDLVRVLNKVLNKVLKESIN